MSFEIMEQKVPPPFYGSSVSLSFHSEEVCFPTERKLGFWRQESASSVHGLGLDAMMSTEAGGRPNISSSLDKLAKQPGVFQRRGLAISPDCFWEAPKAKPNFESRFSGVELNKSLSPITWRVANQTLGLREASCMPYSSSLTDKNLDKLDSFNINGGNSHFSSSFSTLFESKLNLSSHDAVADHFVDTATTQLEEDDLFLSLEELESHTIGNLLPDDDELLSSLVDEVDCIAQSNNVEEIEDFDLFSSGGGMELEADTCDSSNGCKSLDVFGGVPTSQQGGSNGSVAGEHPYGEHPSRTLFVRNINSNVEDSELRSLFEQYGTIRTLYTACKHRGFVMISYYDIRAARGAMRALQNKPLKRRKLDIHFSIPKDNPSDKDVNQGTLVVFNLDPSVSNDDLRQIFGVHGEIKEIRETPHKRHHKFIEFYDVRAAEKALKVLNKSDIAGKRIKLEPSRPGGARRCLMQQSCQELEQEEVHTYWQQGASSANNSPSGPDTRWGMPSSSIDSGAMQTLHSTSHVPLSLFMESSLHGVSSSVPHHLSSPIRVAAIGNHGGQAVQGEPGHSLGHMSPGIHRLPSFHPQSLPEYTNDVINSLSYNPSAAVSAMTAAMPSRPAESIEVRSLHRVSSNNMNNLSFDRNDSVFGVAGNGSLLNPHSSPSGNGPLHAHQFVQGNPNSYHHHLHNPIMWSASPPYAHGVHVRPQPQSQPQPHCFPGSHSHLINAVLPSQHHHVGSAPITNLSHLDRRHGYIRESPETSLFSPGSLGAVGLCGTHGVHPLQFGTHTLMSQMSVNGVVDPTVSSPSLGAMSPQQRCLVFPNNGSPMSIHGSLENANERGRSRRIDNNSNQVDNRKQYQLDIDRILRGEDTRTTLMIKNIPNKYTSKMLLAAIDEQFRGTYDFIYLPIDFKNKCNVGYSFINMIDPLHIVPFFQAFNGKKWEKFNSEKVASLAYARIQGKAALIAHFQNSSLMNEDKRCRPIIFHSEGPNVGDQEPFPVGVNVRTRPGKGRTNNSGSHQGSPSNSGNGDDCTNDMESSIYSLEKDGE